MADKTRPCEICGQPIDAERAEVLPETRLCAEHAQQIRKYGGEFVVTGKHSSLSKPGSLKPNYGDVSLDSKKRNTLALEKLRDGYERHKAQPPE